MSDDTRTFTIFIIARLFSSYILLGHFEWSGFERKLGDFQTFSGMLANVWFSSETFPERCGSGGHGEIEKLIRAVLFPLSPLVGSTKEKKNILLQDIFQIVKNIFLLIKNIARAGNSEGYQVFLKTKKYCNFPRCPQKYFSNVPLTPDPRRWKYSPARHLTLPHLDKIFAPTTITSMIQLIAIHTVLQNTLDKNHFRIIFEIANCGSRILAMSFISVRLAHIVASSIFSSAIMWCCLMFDVFHEGVPSWQPMFHHPASSNDYHMILWWSPYIRK